MNLQEKCEAILRRVVEIVNKDGVVAFEDDFGGNTLTVIAGQGHTHVGVPDGSFELLVENLYNTLHGGPGLSWVPEPPTAITGKVYEKPKPLLRQSFPREEDE